MVPNPICPICGKARPIPPPPGKSWGARETECASWRDHQRIWTIARPGWQRLVYHVRFAWHLWRKVPGMSFWSAWTYPIDPTVGDGDPIEDAQAEMSEMRP